MSSSKVILVVSIGLYAGSVVSAVLATRRLNGKPVKGNTKEYLKAYAPSAILFAAGTGLLVSSNIRDARHFESLMSAYKMSQVALSDIQAAVPQKVLVDAEARVLQEKVDNDFKIPAGDEMLIQPNVYCLDKTTGQSFVSSVEKIHKACQALNYQVINHMQATMDDYCYELGIEPISGGGQIGWTSGPVTFNLTTRLKDDVLPVVVVTVNPLATLLF